MTLETTKPRLIIIVGPTAVGKTALALALADHLGGEIISADSMQVYRHMDIGTAKPSPEERQQVRHHLLDVVNPDESFNAALFVDTAAPIIQALHQQSKAILVVGGTGLYVRALLGGLVAGPGADEDLRNYYRGQQETRGTGYLYQELKRIDARAAARIDPHNAVRIIRALEVMALTGDSIVDMQEQHGFLDKRYECIRIGLTLDRAALYERIDQRTQAMMDAGLIDEVRKLVDMGYGESLKPMQSLGYKHVFPYLEGHIGIDEVMQRTARDTRHYSKRQGTWFRAEPGVQWFSPNDFSEIKEYVRQFLAGGNPEIA